MIFFQKIKIKSKQKINEKKNCCRALPQGMYGRDRNPLEPQSRFGDKPLNFQVVWPPKWDYGSKKQHHYLLLYI